MLAPEGLCFPANHQEPGYRPAKPSTSNEQPQEEFAMHATRILGAIAIAFGLAAAGPIYAQDKAKASAKEHEPVTKVLLENDKVKVTQSTFKPGDVSRSDRKARANYIVKGGTLERTSKDGKKTVTERKTGTVVWLDADSDAVKNIGKTTFVVVSTQIK
jgi:hypothetical protein